MLQPTQFVLNNPVRFEETRHFEFKEVKGKNPVDSIKNTCDEYAVAFLNRDGGRVYWGIRDKDRTVVGVLLTYSQRDKLRRIVTEKLGNISPKLSPSAYRIELHTVGDNSHNPITDLFVVELVVPKPSSKSLYHTGGNDVFMRTDGGKKKLTVSEIEDEVKRRYTINSTYRHQAIKSPIRSLSIELEKTFNGHQNWVWGVDYSKKQNVIVSVSSDTTAVVWDVSGKRANLMLEDRYHTRHDHEYPTSVAIGSLNRLVALGHRDNKITIWNLRNGQFIRKLVTEQYSHTPISHLKFFDKDSKIISWGSGGIKKWNIKTGECIYQTNTTGISDDLISLTVIQEEGELLVRDLDSEKVLVTFDVYGYEIRQLRFSHDNQFLVAGTQDGTILIWDLNAQEQIHCIQEHFEELTFLLLSPDNRFLVSASKDKTLRFWDMFDGHELHQIKLDKLVNCAVIRDNQMVIGLQTEKYLKEQELIELWNLKVL